MADVLLNIVDDKDEIVGEALRSVIHRQGLLHREVHVWYVTPSGGLIFQRRSASKETYPNFLDATAGGHVELGQSYEEAALAEVLEETGLVLKNDDLIELGKISLVNDDSERGLVNRVFRMIYAYRYSGKLEDLEIEAEDGAGFVVLPYAEARTGESELARQIVPRIFGTDYAPAWNALEKELGI